MNDRDWTAKVVGYLAPGRGEVILDLGCGSGRELALILRSSTARKVIGVDISEHQVAAGRRRLAKHVKRGAAEVLVVDAGGPLPFPARTFHAVLSVDLLECLPEIKQRHLLRELRRVLKPGGRVVLAHTDWDTQVWNATDRGLERRLVHAFCDWKQGWMESADGWMGRKLLGLIRKSRQFREVKVAADVLINDRYTPGSFGYERSRDLLDLARKVRGVKDRDVRRFLGDLRGRDRAGAYFYSANRYVVMARRR
jgi:ubiquinone/menaquinone biosynthesis C-methylase UbiE